MIQIWSFIQAFVLGPKTPEVVEYLSAVKSGKLTSRTDFERIVFDKTEKRFQNDQVYVLYLKSEPEEIMETVETVDLVIRGRVGGLVVTFGKEGILTFTKDGQTTKELEITNEEKATLYQILNIIRKAN